MEFEIILQKRHTVVNDEKVHPPRETIEISGELGAVKTYLKLVAGADFKWGAVQRIDNLVTGDVERWMIQQNMTTGELYMSVFSFFDVDPMINVNAYMETWEPTQGMKTLNNLLGGGKF